MAAQTFIQQNQVPNEVELKDLLQLHRKQTLQGLNCHHVATIEEFDADTQLATVKLVYKKTIFQPNAATGGYDPVLVDYPPIVDCPTIILGGGPAALTFPIAQGDECLVLFNDRDIDNWYSGAANGPVATPRLHAFADAIVLVGLRSLANTLTDYDTERAVFRFGNARVTVGETEATVEFGDEGDPARVEVSDGQVSLTVGTNSFTITEDDTTFNIGGATIVATDSDVKITIGTTVLELTSAGKFSVTNASGEFVALLLDILQAIAGGSAGGYPLLPLPAYATKLPLLTSFKA